MTATLPVRSALACVLSLFTCSLLAAQEGPRLPPSPDVPETETETAVAEAAQLTPPTSVRYAYASDWRQAGPGEGQLGSRLRSHIVRLDADGILECASGSSGVVRSWRRRSHWLTAVSRSAD